MGKWMQGKFKPNNPQKYRGNVKNIVYRSQWELNFMMKLDNNPNVMWYQSEEVIVPYTHPITGNYRRYFPDFVYCIREGGVDRVIMVEIKPAAQTKLPRAKSSKTLTESKKSNKKLQVEQARFLENQAKWESAQRYCAKKGWEFQVLTEKELGQF